jgi:hypothetical protein
MMDEECAIDITGVDIIYERENAYMKISNSDDTGAQAP